MADNRLELWKTIIQALQAIGILVAGIAIPVVLHLSGEANRQNELYAQIMSQREQADSALREKMFSGLLSSYFGQQACQQDANKQMLLLHLLSVNFQEFFDASPLFEDLDKRLSEEGKDRLYAIASELVDKQVNQLSKTEDTPQVLKLDFVGDNKKPFILRTRQGQKSFTLELLDIEPSRIRVRVTAESPAPQTSDAFKNVDFYVSRFTMPYMHNTRLEDGTRFSVTLENLDQEHKMARARITRFPDTYMSLRDRPYVDELYSKLREMR
jgi:hypothetical protein